MVAPSSRSQSSLFLPQARRIVGSGDENVKGDQRNRAFTQFTNARMNESGHSRPSRDKRQELWGREWKVVKQIGEQPRPQGSLSSCAGNREGGGVWGVKQKAFFTFSRMRRQKSPLLSLSTHVFTRRDGGFSNGRFRLVVYC